MKLYRRISEHDEYSNFGDRHSVGVYGVKNVEKVHEEQYGHKGSYGEPCGMSWYVDRQGHIYTHLHADGMGYKRDDNTVWFSRPLNMFARDIFWNPITKYTPKEINRTK